VGLNPTPMVPARPPPTDPDVRVSRIRLFELRVRCASVNRVDYPDWRKRMALRQLVEVSPRQSRCLRPTAEPLVPQPVDPVAETRERYRVPGDAVVRVVPSELKPVPIGRQGQ